MAGAEPGTEAERFLVELVRFAHAFGARVIVEGIETETELSLCRSARCDFAQGFLLGRPVTAGRLDPGPGPSPDP